MALIFAQPVGSAREEDVGLAPHSFGYATSVDPSSACVFVASGEVEAQQMRAFLEAHDIPCAFRGEALRKTHGLTLDGLGQVEIVVPGDCVERARQLIAAAAAGELALPDDAEPLF